MYDYYAKGLFSAFFDTFSALGPAKITKYDRPDSPFSNKVAVCHKTSIFRIIRV